MQTVVLRVQTKAGGKRTFSNDRDQKGSRKVNAWRVQPRQQISLSPPTGEVNRKFTGDLISKGTLHKIAIWKPKKPRFPPKDSFKLKNCIKAPEVIASKISEETNVHIWSKILLRNRVLCHKRYELQFFYVLYQLCELFKVN